MSTNLNSLPKNQKEVFETQHYTDNENFINPLDAKLNDKQIKLRIRFSDDSNVTTNTPSLEGEPLSDNISDSDRATNIAPKILNPERVPVLGNRDDSIA